MKALPITISVIAMAALFAACSDQKKDSHSSQSEENLQPTAEVQKSLTPDSVIQDLVDGNLSFASGQIAGPNIEARREAATAGQFPKAYVLSCVDSRVPVEQVFNQGIGDIFVGRVAGNIETAEQLGSMEFAAAVAGVKVIMVLGHEACGAVKGAADSVELENLTTLLEQIQPAISQVQGHEGEKTSKNEAFINDLIEQNVAKTVSDIRQRSEVLAKLEKEGKLKILGGVYSLETGQVTLLN